jgi:hypothetical protein
VPADIPLASRPGCNGVLMPRFRRSKPVEQPDAVKEARDLVARLVRAGAPDNVVVERLRAGVTGGLITLQQLAERLEGPAHIGYPADRWRALTLAAAEERPAPEVEPEKAAADEEQRQLSLMDSADGFALLALRVPELVDLDRRLRAARPLESWSGWRPPPRPTVRPVDALRPLLQEMRTLVGPESGHEDPLVRSTTALLVVFHHCEDLGEHGVPDPFE